MYKNILVPVLLDAEHADHDNAFATARALADEGAAFTVLHVSEAVSGFVEAEIPHHVIEERREKEAAAVADIAKALPQAEARLVVGHAGNTIVDFAKTNDIDCIVIESHKPGFSDYFLGSTASRVIRHAACSVHVIR